MITKLTELAEKAINSGKKTRIAVAVAEDSNTINAILKATNNGFVSPILIGNKDKITALLPADIDSNKLQIMNITDPAMAVKEAVRMVRNNEADVLMKGLVGTETF
jgi:phosphate butyryltransferase